jgi:hypothetical protein
MADTNSKQLYICPMHPEVLLDQPGSCPQCGMKLVPKSEVNNSTVPATNSKWQLYRPLSIIIGLILLPNVALFLTGASVEESMYNFMAGFFLVFAGFKLLDLRGFALAYSTYDLLARRVYSYGYLYPFIELSLGLAYLTRVAIPWVNILTLLVMAFSGLGVLLSLREKRKFQCACLGTIIKVPLTNVTLVEDFGMALMAAVLVS